VKLRNTIIYEWIGHLTTLQGPSRAKESLALGATLQREKLPNSHRRQISEHLVLTSRERLSHGFKDIAIEIANQARKFEDTAPARQILVEAKSKPQRTFVPGGVYGVGTPSNQTTRLVKECLEQLRDPGKCREVRFQAEGDRREVEISSFFMARNETTVAQFRGCVDAGACTRQHFDNAPQCPYDREDGNRLPMSCIDWIGAVQYCSFAGGRLPTEVEWEISAADVGGRSYPWGNDPPDSSRTNLADKSAGMEGTAFPYDPERNDGFSRNAPVGSFPRGSTPSGVNDLSGNVAEWVLDWFRPNSIPTRPEAIHPVSNPRGPCSGRSPCPGQTRRSVRGGGYNSLPVELRNQARSGVRPSEVHPWLGFRCVWDDSPSL